jgi:hypothetical protein
LAGAPCAGDQRRFDAHLEHFGGKLLLEEYAVHKVRILGDET